MECEPDLSSQTFTEPSFPVDISVLPGMFTIQLTARIDVVATSCPANVRIQRRVFLSIRSILLDGEEAEAAKVVERFARERTYESSWLNAVDANGPGDSYKDGDSSMTFCFLFSVGVLTS